MSGPTRLAILAEGHFDRLEAKTATGVLRYRGEEVVAVIDSTRAGRTAEECVGFGGEVPVVADVAAAGAAGANELMIGIAPRGGQLPDPWRDVVGDALDRGWVVWSGLHEFLGDDPALAARAARHGGRIHDVRRPPAGRPIGSGRAATVEALVVLTIGTDCNVGKMTCALELVRGLVRRGLRAAFVATGQTGIFIAGAGVAVDAVPADFVAGVVEDMVLGAAGDADIVVVEGQGALHHPGYAGVTLGLVHGACPAAMILCHDAGRTHIRTADADDACPPVPSLAVARDAHEVAASWVSPGRVVGVALNTAALDEAGARDTLARAGNTLGIPAADPVRHTPEPLIDALIAARAARRRDPRRPPTNPEVSCA